MSTWWAVGRQSPLLLLHGVQLLQLSLVLHLHATQHLPDHHHEGIELEEEEVKRSVAKVKLPTGYSCTNIHSEIKLHR